MDSVLLSTSDAARPLGVSTRTARRLAASGRLTAKRIGPVWVVQERDLDEYIRTTRRGTDGPRASTSPGVCG